jgi:uncharacterized protein HemX
MPATAATSTNTSAHTTTTTATDHYHSKQDGSLRHKFYAVFRLSLALSLYLYLFRSRHIPPSLFQLFQEDIVLHQSEVKSIKDVIANLDQQIADLQTSRKRARAQLEAEQAHIKESYNFAQKLDREATLPPSG